MEAGAQNSLLHPSESVRPSVGRLVAQSTLESSKAFLSHDAEFGAVTQPTTAAAANDDTVLEAELASAPPADVPLLTVTRQQDRLNRTKPSWIKPKEGRMHACMHVGYQRAG